MTSAFVLSGWQIVRLLTKHETCELTSGGQNASFEGKAAGRSSLMEHFFSKRNSENRLR